MTLRLFLLRTVVQVAYAAAIAYGVWSLWDHLSTQMTAALRGLGV
jgi:hypothetical protein